LRAVAPLSPNAAERRPGGRRHVLHWAAGVRGFPEDDMQYYTFEIVIEKEAEDEGYFAHTPTMPGCFSNGRTIEEAKRNIRDAIRQHVESLLAHGEAVPQSERLVHVEELTVGIAG
jgi:predicted RNase H-like HicB family nuclease